MFVHVAIGCCKGLFRFPPRGLFFCAAAAFTHLAAAMARLTDYVARFLLSVAALVPVSGAEAPDCRSTSKWHTMLECPDNYACHICVQVLEELRASSLSHGPGDGDWPSQWCAQVGGCHIMNVSAASVLGFNGQKARDFCAHTAGLCPVDEQWQVYSRLYGPLSPIDLRVTKAMGSKGYDVIRISVVHSGNGLFLASSHGEPSAIDPVWKKHAGINCYLQHGGTPVDAEDMPSIVSLAACQGSCAVNPSCQAIVVQAGGGNTSRLCWLRKAIDLIACEASGGYDTFELSGGSSPTPPPPFPPSPPAPAPPVQVSWQYQGQFKYRWTQYFLQTALVKIVPGVSNTVNVNGVPVEISIPLENTGTAGLIIADPCLSQSSWCVFEDRLQISHRLVALINAAFQHDDVSFWLNVGDLFYDQAGDITKGFFDQLSLQSKAKLHGVTMGNHDYWIGGSPGAQSPADSFGNGHMQWYAMDTVASTSSQKPFDFSIDPGTKEIAKVTNFVWYHKVGDIALMGFSGAHTFSETLPHFAEGCRWFQEQNPKVAVVVGHWDVPGDGAAEDMATPGAWKKVQVLPGCKELGHRLKYFMGHTHCNNPNGDGAGFRVAGFGMNGCGNFGLPVLDTTLGRIRVLYFSIADAGGLNRFDPIVNCIQQAGWSKCTHLADVWLDQAVNDFFGEEEGLAASPTLGAVVV